MAARYAASCDCGFDGRYASEAMADYALRRHSCDRQRERASMARRVAERVAADGPRRDCEHPIAHHEHGTHAAYVLDQCRCRPCRDANRAYERQRTRRHLYGTFTRDGLTDATEARERVRALLAAGVSLKQVARVSGVSRGALSKLIYGGPGERPPSRRIRPATATALLAVEPTLDVLADGARVDPTGSTRRLRALVALGYPAAELARRSGVERRAIDALLAGERGCVARTARQVAALYDALSMRTPKPSDARFAAAVTRSRRRAAEAGWAPPLAWDDDAIEDVRAQNLAEARHAGVEQMQQERAALIEDIEWMLANGETDMETIATRVGTTAAALERRLYRAGRSDLVARTACAHCGEPRRECEYYLAAKRRRRPSAVGGAA